MPFIHVNEYYINLAHIYYVHDTEKGYLVYFGAGKVTTVDKSSPAGESFIHAIRASTNILGD